MNQPITDIETLHARLDDKRREVREQENRIASCWNELFHHADIEHSRLSKGNFAQRAIVMASDFSEIADGVILGWKLYKRFKGGIFSFGRKRNRRS